MRFTVALRALSIAAVASLAACGEMPSAPATPSLDLAAPSLAQSAKAGPSVPQTVTIRVNTGVSAVYGIGGQNWVYIPAGALCDDDAGYGPELWDAPCTPATGTVAIDVTSFAINGRPAAEFHKDVRFTRSGSANWRDWVILGLKVQGNMNGQLGYGILYRPTGSSRWVDESVDDPTLRAFRATGNVIARRLKHFSGYNVSLGIYEETVDPLAGALIEGAF